MHKSISFFEHRLIFYNPCSLATKLAKHCLISHESWQNKLFLLSLVLLFLAKQGQAQIYPVSSTPRLIPPYSVYLPDMVAPGNEKLQTVLLLRDLTQPSLDIRLRVEIHHNGRLLMRTSALYNPLPITLFPGQPTIISGVDLAPYLESQNLDFVGYDRNQYERNKVVPEGSYQICIRAFDYDRPEVALSDPQMSCAFAILQRAEPPMTNLPICGSTVPVQLPQQMLFSWISRNTASPNSALNTEYEFSLYEVRPEGANPNDIVLSTPPVFQIRTQQNQFIYGISEPPLFENMTYAWRVRAIDLSGRDAFRNQGFSEVCSFTYKGSLGGLQAGLVEDFAAEGKTERRADFSWKADPERFDGYRIEYKKVGEGWRWYSLEMDSGDKNSTKIFDLHESTAYEARIQGKKDGFYGPYSEKVPFSTTAIRVSECAPSNPNLETVGGPLTSAYKNMIVDAYGKPMTCQEITPLDQPGWFKGSGYVRFDEFKGINLAVAFDRIQIDENLRVISGRIYSVSAKIAPQGDAEEVDSSSTAFIQAQNQAAWEDVEFYHEITAYNHHAIDSITFNPATGELYVYVEQNDAVFLNTVVPPILVDNPEDAVIIEDKNGDQWVIDKDGKVHEVRGGGLKPGKDTSVPKEVEDVLQAALAQIHGEYALKNLKDLKTVYQELDEQVKATYPQLDEANDNDQEGAIFEWEVIEQGEAHFLI